MFTLIDFLIKLLGGYTKQEYNQVLIEVTALTNTISVKSDQIEMLNAEKTTLSEKNKKLQEENESLSKVKDSLIIHVEGGKVWVEDNE